MSNCEVFALPNGRAYMDGRCYVLCCRQSGRCMVVDPDLCAEAVEELLAAENLTLQGVLLTHGHFDHIGSAGQLVQAHAVPLYIHPLDAPMLATAEGNLSANAGAEPFAIDAATRPLAEGMQLPLGGSAVTVLHTPGHTPGSCCFVWGDVLISGDLLFCGGVGRTDLPGGDSAQLAQSLGRLKALPAQLTVCPGHGQPTTLQREARTITYYSGV